MRRLENKAAVIGWPVRQSLSPAIHAFWRQQYSTSGAYRRIACAPDNESFTVCLSELRRLGYAGVNVTIPHKKHAFDIADRRTETAEMLGVANMLTFADGQIFADNSDVAGFEKMIKPILGRNDRRALALVLGAGGTTPAVCLALHNLGTCEIVIANRTLNRATEMAERYDFIKGICAWSDIPTILGGADMLVNTTPLGMTGQPALSIDLTGAKPDLVVADIVYTPLETPLIKAAKERGLRNQSGLAMLAHQAAPGFERWFGVTPDVSDELMQHLIDKLQMFRSRPVKIGVTGSIGMGKSTATRVLREQGAAVWDADSAVHRLYAKGGAAVAAVERAFPGVIKDGAISRKKLGEHLMMHPDGFREIEKIVHPLVAEDRKGFYDSAVEQDARAVVMDIPLLFETGQSQDFDAVIVVTANSDARRHRVLARAGMSEDRFASIVAQQMSEEEKRLLGDYVVYTDGPIEETTECLRKIFREILENYHQE